MALLVALEPETGRSRYNECVWTRGAQAQQVRPLTEEAVKYFHSVYLWLLIIYRVSAGLLPNRLQGVSENVTYSGRDV